MTDKKLSPKDERRLATYDRAIDAAFRKFKNHRACDETFDAMCDWAQAWLARRKLRALVSWSSDGKGSVAFQVNDLTKLEQAEFAGKPEM